MSGSIERLSFELSVAALREQERAVAGLRTRAAAVLATASVAGSLARVGNGRGAFDVVGTLALISFVLTAWFAIWILLPHEFAFSSRGQDVLELADSVGSRDVGHVLRQAGLWLDECAQGNRTSLKRLAACLTWSCVLLSLEIVLVGVGFAG